MYNIVFAQQCVCVFWRHYGALRPNLALHTRGVCVCVASVNMSERQRTPVSQGWLRASIGWLALEHSVPTSTHTGSSRISSQLCHTTIYTSGCNQTLTCSYDGDWYFQFFSCATSDQRPWLPRDRLFISTLLCLDMSFLGAAGDGGKRDLTVSLSVWSTRFCFT